MCVVYNVFRFVSPTPDSHRTRLAVLDRFKAAVTAVWPGCRVDTFGSFATGLYLPTSDLDLVIFGRWPTVPFQSLKNILLPLAAHNSIEIIDSAVVPIVRYDDSVTGVKVDISFNNVSGTQSAEVIKAFKLQFPELAPLISVLKQFLVERDLATVYTGEDTILHAVVICLLTASGGLSSYSLTLMVVSFLQLHARPATANLGVLLLEFLELYGRNFNYDSLTISVRDVGLFLAAKAAPISRNVR